MCAFVRDSTAQIRLSRKWKALFPRIIRLLLPLPIFFPPPLMGEGAMRLLASFERMLDEMAVEDGARVRVEEGYRHRTAARSKNSAISGGVKSKARS